MAKRSIAQKRQQKAIKRKKKKQAQHVKERLAISHATEAAEFPKLSETILEFAKPILGNSRDKHFIENTIGMVIMCWNIGAVNYQMAQEMRVELDRKFSEYEDLPEELELELDLLIAGRRSFFANDPRMVVEYDISWNMLGEPHLQVLSTILPEDARFNPNDREHFTFGFSTRSQERISDLETPATEEQAPIAELISKGYKLLHEDSGAFDTSFPEICDYWLEAWEKVKALYQDSDSISDIKAFAGVYLSNWCSNLEMYLYDAGRKDPSYFDKRIQYCREFCQAFPASEPQIMHVTKNL